MTLTRIEGRPARQTAASAPSGGCAAAGTAASEAATRPAFAMNFNMITLLPGADAVRANAIGMIVPCPHGAQIVQACGQIMVAARRNGEKVTPRQPGSPDFPMTDPFSPSIASHT